MTIYQTGSLLSPRPNGERSRERVNRYKHVHYARDLRRQQAPSEKPIWGASRRNQLGGFKFKRPVPIDPYIADFVSFPGKLIVEIDGAGHDQTFSYVEAGISFLWKEGFDLVRLSNEDIRKNLGGVIETIRLTIEDRDER